MLSKLKIPADNTQIGSMLITDKTILRLPFRNYEADFLTNWEEMIPPLNVSIVILILI